MVTVKDLRTSNELVEQFDGVMICNGHYHTPNIPHLPEDEIFEGHQMHSHDYRDPETFRNKRVLVIGAGPSGMDIALQIASTAKHVGFILSTIMRLLYFQNRKEVHIQINKNK